MLNRNKIQNKQTLGKDSQLSQNISMLQFTLYILSQFKVPDWQSNTICQKTKVKYVTKDELNIKCLYHNVQYTGSF